MFVEIIATGQVGLLGLCEIQQIEGKSLGINNQNPIWGGSEGELSAWLFEMPE
jgi:hypothetical protein